MRQLQSDVEVHDRKHCALCQAPAYLANGQPNAEAIHHMLELMVAMGRLKKFAKDITEPTLNVKADVVYVEVLKGICFRCGNVFEIPTVQVPSVFCDHPGCNALNITEDALQRFRESFT